MGAGKLSLGNHLANFQVKHKHDTGPIINDYINVGDIYFIIADLMGAGKLSLGNHSPNFQVKHKHDTGRLLAII